MNRVCLWLQVGLLCVILRRMLGRRESTVLSIPLVLEREMGRLEWRVQAFFLAS
jgi:hypothetical protein